MHCFIKSFFSICLFTTSLCSVAAEVSELIVTPLESLSDNSEIQLLEVTLSPGESVPQHHHDAYVYLYVLEGMVEMQVEGSKLHSLGQGEVFSELPHDVHTVSRNASQTETARFIAFVIKKQGKPVTILEQENLITD